ncbi:MAG: universal stress protein [Deltaproteobacteria bacterium]|nr:universal stress protein [Deltaproteobacteria bacterium]
MIRKVLLALDGSKYSAAVTDVGVYFVAKLNARILGIHVVDSVALEGPFIHDIAGAMGFEPFINFSTKMRDALEETGRSILDIFKTTCIKEQRECDTRLLSGIISNELCDTAKLSDLIVIGRRGVNASFEHGLLGSATEGVIRKSPRPVLVVPEVFTPPTKPLIAFDGSEHSVNVLRSAADLVNSLGLELTVLTVGSADEADKILKEAEDYLKPHDVKATFKRIEGDHKTSIVKYHNEEGHDLLFMGTTHHSRVVEMVIGSTAEYVLRSVESPVFLER